MAANKTVGFRFPSRESLLEIIPDDDDFKLAKTIWKLPDSLLKEVTKGYWPQDNKLEKLLKISKFPKTHNNLSRIHGGWSVLEFKLQLLNELLEYHGVEYLGYWTRDHEECYFLNAGDMYIPTLMIHNTSLLIRDCGTLIEKKYVKPYNSHTGQHSWTD